MAFQREGGGGNSPQFPGRGASGVEKVSEPGNLVPRNFFELRVLQKIFQKIFQHFEITLFTQLTSYNCSTLFTLYMLTSAPF